jgi:hypothetical protein
MDLRMKITVEPVKHVWSIVDLRKAGGRRLRPASKRQGWCDAALSKYVPYCVDFSVRSPCGVDVTWTIGEERDDGTTLVVDAKLSVHGA